MRFIFYRILGGLLFILIGLLIWFSNMEILNIEWKRDWPVILVVIGLIELVKNIIRKK